MKWFKEVFLPSFGFCEGRRVSEKQGEIFMKYLDPEDHSDYNATYYSKKFKDKFVKLQVSSSYNGCYYNKTGRHTLYRNNYYVDIKEV